MAHFVIPSRRTRQPQGAVRVSSAYSGNAVVCYNFADRSARSVGKNPQLWTTITNFSFGVRAGLSGLVCDGTGNYLESVESFLPVGSSPRTVIQVVNITTSGSSASPLYNWGSAADGQAFGVNLNNDAQTINVWVWGSGDKSFSDTSIAAGRQNNIVATHANGNTSVWNSGKALGTQAQTINTVSSGYQRLNKLPAFYDVAHHYFIGVQSLVAVLDREVSSAEGLELSINPWQLFAPDPRRLYFGASGGGATIITTSGAASLVARAAAAVTATKTATASSRAAITSAASATSIRTSALVAKANSAGAAATTTIRTATIAARTAGTGTAATTTLRTGIAAGRIASNAQTTYAAIAAGAFAAAGRTTARGTAAYTSTHAATAAAAATATGATAATSNRTGIAAARLDARAAVTAAALVAGTVTTTAAAQISARASVSNTTERVATLAAMLVLRGAAPEAPDLPVTIPPSTRTLSPDHARLGLSPVAPAKPRLG